MTEPTFIPFARPDIGEEEIAAVAHAMRSGWVTTGPETRAFEEEFAAYLGSSSQQPLQAIAVNSATAGLHLALLPLDAACHEVRIDRREGMGDDHVDR